MMKIKYLVLVALAVLLTSCKEDVGDFSMNFKATYDGSTLVMGDDLVYADGSMIRITESDFYLSEVKLVNTEGEVILTEVDFIDFTNNNTDMAKAEEGINLNFIDIPAGDYSKLVFSIGVSPENNQKLPSDFVSTNPLSKSAYYWQAWDSYIFAKLAGKYEADGNFNSGYFFHTGTNELYSTLEVTAPISIVKEGSSTINIQMDHKKLFGLDNGTLFDIQNSAVNHDPTDIGPLQMIVNNYVNAMTFSQ